VEHDDGHTEDARPEPSVRRRDPADTLRMALVTYVFVNLLVGVPILLVPVGFFETIGVPSIVARDFAGLRWVGAILVAWGVSGLLVMARPYGRAYFVTVGSLQMTFAAAALVFSWQAGEGIGDLWFQASAAIVYAATALYLWWARLRARSVLAADVVEVTD